MKSTKSLLLVTLLTIAVTLIGCGTMGPGGCDGSATDPPPNDVTFENGQVKAPGATIVVNGQVYSDQAPVGDEALVGIVKDGQAYLYHPALGPAELSDYNSRRAVGLFIAQSSGETPEGKLIRDTSTWLVIGESTEASTGITVERVGDATYEVTNNKRRWAAVKSGATGEPRFLLPRASLIETNLIQLVVGLVSGDSSTGNSRQIPVDEAEVATFGAVVRANSLLGVPVIGGQLIQKARTALDQDMTLFLRLNAVDYMTVTIEGVMSIAGLFPFECADAVINGAVLNAFETLGVGLLTGDEALTEEFALAMAADMAQSTAGCVCVVSSALVCEVLTTFLDILAAVNWVIDDNIVGAWHVITNDAYASVAGIAPSDNCPDDPNKTEPGNCGCGVPETPGCGSTFTWQPLGSGMNSFLRELAVVNGELIAGGEMSAAGGANANKIARWNGTTWLPLGSGMSSGVWALTEYNGELVAGGQFNTAGGIAANKIARWDGTNWQPFGSGMNNSVWALAVHKGELIAGGQFTTAGGVGASRIARWNGTNWQPLSTGMGSQVASLTIYNNELIAGGWFSTAGSVSANRIARWDGTAWHPLGSGFGGLATSVQALTVYNGDLIAGGSFTALGGTSASNIALWDGMTWQPLGTGINGGRVNALHVYNGDLIAGGSFTAAGGTSAGSIALWDGFSWQPLGTGMEYSSPSYPFVYALTIYGGDLIAGGRFTTAGGFGANSIARWGPSP